MFDDPEELLAERPEWLRILHVYSHEAEHVTSEEESNSWVARISHVDGVQDADLSDLHGQLIAFGWLTFQIDPQRGGLCYRLTPEARSLVNRYPEDALPESEDAPSSPRPVDAAIPA